MSSPIVVAVSSSRDHTFSKSNQPSITLIQGLGIEGDAHSGKTVKHRFLAKKDPAKPPNMAPIANADSFVLVGFIPNERQAISSSRNASHARPTGSFRIRIVNAFVISARIRIR